MQQKSREHDLQRRAGQISVCQSYLTFQEQGHEEAQADALEGPEG